MTSSLFLFFFCFFCFDFVLELLVVKFGILWCRQPSSLIMMCMFNSEV